MGMIEEDRGMLGKDRWKRIEDGEGRTEEYRKGREE
jgi:hypothetical protein